MIVMVTLAVAMEVMAVGIRAVAGCKETGDTGVGFRSHTYTSRSTDPS